MTPGTAAEQTAPEAARLRRGINGLTGLIALSASWSGETPARIVDKLGGALFTLLDVDLLVVELAAKRPQADEPLVLAGPELRWAGEPGLGDEVARLLARTSAAEAGTRAPVLGIDMSVVRTTLGTGEVLGTILAASRRPSFPTETEALLLNVAANQALAALQQAELRETQLRNSEELDRRVAERTRELAEANAALRVEVAERQRAEEALRESELRSTSLIEGIPGFVAVLAPDGRVERVNRQIEEYCGQSLDELRNWGTNGTVHPEDMPHVAEVFGASILLGTPYIIEQRLRRHDGEYRWFDNRGRPLRDESGAIVAWHVLLTDIDDRRRAEEAVRSSERELRQQAETFPQMLWSATAEGAIDYCNGRLLAYSGLDSETVMGGGWVNMLHPDDREATAGTWMHCIATGTPYSVEVRHYHAATGSHRWNLVLALPLRDPDGRVTKWYGSCVDIHDRKLAEEGLKASERHLAQIIDTIPAYVWSADADGATGFYNRHYLEYLGQPFEALAGSSWTSVIHPDDLGGHLDPWREALETGRPFEAQSRVRRHDGTYRWFLHRARPLGEADGSVKWFGVTIDIEDMKRAEALVRESELNLRRLTETIPQNLFSASADGLVNYLNSRMREWFGRADETIMAEEWVHLVHPEDREPTVEAWMAAVAAGASYRRQVRFINRDGQYRWCEALAQPLRDRDGTITAWHGVVNDIHDRKLAEDALKASEQNLRLTIDTIPALVWSARADGTAEFFNRHYLEFVGKAASEIGGWQWIELVHPDDLPLITTSWERCHSTGEGADIETRLRRHDGEYRWFRFQANPLVDADGNVLKWYGINTDIEDRKHAEQELSERERNLREAHDHLTQAQRLSHTGSFTTDVKADAHIWSRELYNILEYPPDAVPTFAAFRDRIHPDDREAFDAAFRRSMADGADFDQVFRIVTPKANTKHLHAVAHFVPETSERPIVIGSIQDITESKRAEYELRRGEYLLSTAEEIAEIGSFSWDLVNNKLVWSAGMYRIWEIDENVEPRSVNLLPRVHPADRPIVEERIAKIFAGEEIPEALERIYMPDGRMKYINGLTRLFRYDDGRLECVGVTQDITRRRLMEDALDQLRSELAHVTRVSSLGELAGSIAHEVNQPLSGIITNASTCLRLLTAGRPDVEGAIKTAQRTLRDGNRASEVIQRLRALFRKQDFQPEPLDINEAVEEVIAICTHDLHRRGVSLKAELERTLPKVVGDRIQLQQVILNLMLNAADACALVADGARQIAVTTSAAPGDFVQFTIRDTGVGLPPGDPAKIFQPFYTTKPDGMGIGLSVSNSILERHGGTVWAVANDGPGATFGFSLPREPATASRDRQQVQ